MTIKQILKIILNIITSAVLSFVLIILVIVLEKMILKHGYIGNILWFIFTVLIFIKLQRLTNKYKKPITKESEIKQSK